MAVPPEQVPEITKISLDRAGERNGVDVTLKSSSLSDNGPITSYDTERGASTLERIKTNFGDRPECFKNTFQEISFVFQATVATATTSFLAGVAMIITVPVSRDLGMTQGEIAWISASTSYV